MFEQTFIQSQTQPRHPWTVAVSLSLQCLAVGLVVLIPLLHVERLRMPDPPPPHVIAAFVPLPPAPAAAVRAVSAAVNFPITPRTLLVVPTIHPGTTLLSAPTELPSGEFSPATQAGIPLAGVGLPNGNSLPQAEPRRQPVTMQPASAPSGPIRVSGGVESARLISGPHPAYPRLAIQTRSQGVVRIEAIIGTDGSIRNLRVLSGPPLLVDAARDAVRQWRYQPLLLNGVATEVITEIEVNFSLTR